MSHYFTVKTDAESNPKDIYFRIAETEFHFVTDNGVFSKSGLDFGSRLLIESVKNISAERVLDLGCGYGPIGLSYKTFNNDSEVVMTDINERAISLTKQNASRLKLNVDVLHGDGFEQVQGNFDLIISNPPVRVGKQLLYDLLLNSKNYLNLDGRLVFVIHKKLGALSSIAFCEENYKKVEVLNKKSGYYIIQCIK